MATSRYRNVNVVDKKSFETSEFPSVQEISTIPTFNIRLSERDRLDNLAFIHLGSGEYWWVIALVNNIDWMYEFDAGDVIKIPIDIQDVLNLV